jgi:hypothetical protein
MTSASTSTIKCAGITTRHEHIRSGLQCRNLLQELQPTNDGAVEEYCKLLLNNGAECCGPSASTMPHFPPSHPHTKAPTKGLPLARMSSTNLTPHALRQSQSQYAPYQGNPQPDDVQSVKTVAGQIPSSALPRASFPQCLPLAVPHLSLPTSPNT